MFWCLNFSQQKQLKHYTYIIKGMFGTKVNAERGECNKQFKIQHLYLFIKKNKKNKKL